MGTLISVMNMLPCRIIIMKMHVQGKTKLLSGASHMWRVWEIGHFGEQKISNTKSSF
jgi:hypothetical protein